MNLLQEAQKENLLGPLVVQLQKDFTRANISIRLPDDWETNPDGLQQMVLEKVYVLLLEDFDGYLNLMYAIDVPERDFKKITPTDIVAVAGQMSDLIIARELQKVRFKKNYGR
ncbi:MAG: hypothetical protein AB3N16_02390 [Flavobacteriaceae bacterium]